MKRFSALFIFFLLVTSSVAEARVFNFKEERFSSYLRGIAGLSNVSSDAFSGASGANTDFDDEVKYNLGGEIGFGYSPSEYFTIRFGLELFQAKPLNNIKGKNATGQQLMDLTSTVFLFGPTAGIDIHFYRTNTSRVIGSLSAGMLKATMENEYKFTATGLADPDLGISADYTEKSEANVISWTLMMGYETLFTDNVTAVFEMGYRYLPISEFNYKNNVAAIGGARSEGDKVIDTNGSTREVDMGGLLIAVGFRFYIDFR